MDILTNSGGSVYARSGVFDPPVMVYFDISRHCPCSVNCFDDDRKNVQVSFNVVMETINEIVEAGVRDVTLKGDDIFFRNDFQYIIDYIINRSLNLYLFIGSAFRKVCGNNLTDGLDIYENPVQYKTARRLIYGYDSCSAGIDSCHITPCRLITPCSYMQVKLGDIREKTFYEAWTSFTFKNNFSLKERADCSGCVLFM